MDQKVSTMLDEDLFRRAERESMRQGKPLSRLLGEALRLYLDEKSGLAPQGGVAARSWGTLKLPSATLKDLLEHEDGFLDALRYIKFPQ
jgi:hypothetical protein